jgi:predicted membrane channel-forming protein YqfA (hemolysin III family)
VLAYDYPLLSVFWTLLEIAAFVIWIWLVIFVLIDIFRSRDMGGWAKALWVILVVLLPLLGVLIYLIARGGGMHDRAVAEAKQRDKEFTSYIQQTAQSSSVANQLDKLDDLKASGAISDDEFQNAKAKILS